MVQLYSPPSLFFLDHGWLSGILMFVFVFNVSSIVNTCIFPRFGSNSGKMLYLRNGALLWKGPLVANRIGE